MWQNSIGEALSFIYNVTNNGPPKKRRRINIEKLVRERMETLRFERMPRVSVQELVFAYDKGIVTWKAFQRNMATFCGLDDTDIKTGPEPWSQEDRKLQITGKTPSTEFKKANDGSGI